MNVTHDTSAFASGGSSGQRASVLTRDAAPEPAWRPCTNCHLDGNTGKTTHAFGCPNDTTRYGSIAQRAERGLAAGLWGEPVKYQARRLLGNEDVIEPFWTDWFDCSKEQYDAYRDDQTRHGCLASEVRALYVGPQATDQIAEAADLIVQAGDGE